MPDGANKGSFVQAYKAQIAVDSASQVIVAAEVTQLSTDCKQLVPMLAQIAMNLEQKPEKASADAGYFSEANVTDASVTGVDLYIATGRDKPRRSNRDDKRRCACWCRSKGTDAA